MIGGSGGNPANTLLNFLTQFDGAHRHHDIIVASPKLPRVPALERVYSGLVPTFSACGEEEVTPTAAEVGTTTTTAPINSHKANADLDEPTEADPHSTVCI